MLTRDKQILAGLFLSKYDSVGLKQLGFESFVEAFNVLGYSLGARPASIKNYRDEFDPMLPECTQRLAQASYSGVLPRGVRKV